MEKLYWELIKCTIIYIETNLSLSHTLNHTESFSFDLCRPCHVYLTP